MPRDNPDGDPGSSPSISGFALPLLFFREVTREVMLAPCEVTLALGEVMGLARE
jgi:hypothetical protein